MRRDRLSSGMVLLLAIVCFVSGQQTPSFIDGYHGGIEGHYPAGTTQFIVNTLNSRPTWKICLEIEPATWQSEAANYPAAYNSFKQLLSTSPGRIEFVSAAYGQPYSWNINGESLVRHFIYGIEEIHRNFPDAVIKSYACEEPCWTSCMPQILKSLGFSYAALKNPLTGWGGYCAGRDAETINWVGPDGSSIPAVPRYAGERANGNCWETEAAYNKTTYIQNARNAGIVHPVGMCFQDAGWTGGPWGTEVASINRTWREYFETVAVTPTVDWIFSQENIRVSLVWGAQVLQGIAQNVRSAENKILLTEKASAMAVLGAGATWRDTDLRDAWRTLMLSQHHDCWIVPTNSHPAGTWALQVANVWVPNTRVKCDTIINQALQRLAAGSGPLGGNQYIRVVNTVSVDRSEASVCTLPAGWSGNYARVYNDRNQEMPCQVTGSSPREVVFTAAVPSLGYATYRVEPSAVAPPFTGATAGVQPDGTMLIETDVYRILLDPARGGAIRSLYAKALSREFVDGASARRFNEYRGYSGSSSTWISSVDAPATIQITENGPVRVTVSASGRIGTHPFVSTITALQGQKRIDMKVQINWAGSPQIGQTWSGGSVMTSIPKPFYNDRYKLQAIFPCALSGTIVLNKNAAYDVCRSTNANTIFGTWDSIKHNIIVNWVDINDAAGTYGCALMSDHTTSCAFGPADPLGLVLAYSGPGLWDVNYTISGPTIVRYAVVPHAGTWDQAQIGKENCQWGEPLLAQMMAASPASQAPAKSLMRTPPGVLVQTLVMDGSRLLVRLFNAEGNAGEKTVSFGFVPSGAELIELDGRVISPLSVAPDTQMASLVRVTMPRFGVRTLRLSGCQWSLFTGVSSAEAVPGRFAIESLRNGIAVLSVPAPGRYSAELFSLDGRRVATLWNGRLTTGEHTLSFGRQTASNGILLFALTDPSGRKTVMKIIALQ